MCAEHEPQGSSQSTHPPGQSPPYFGVIPCVQAYIHLSPGTDTPHPEDPKPSTIGAPVGFSWRGAGEWLHVPFQVLPWHVGGMYPPPETLEAVVLSFPFHRQRN